MNNGLSHAVEAWEAEGGAVLSPNCGSLVLLNGTANQVEWAERIRDRVIADFDRVAKSFHTVAGKQAADKRAGTEAIIDILEDRRAAVMRQEQAGYFIRGMAGNWRSGTAVDSSGPPLPGDEAQPAAHDSTIQRKIGDV